MPFHALWRSSIECRTGPLAGRPSGDARTNPIPPVRPGDSIGRSTPRTARTEPISPMEEGRRPGPSPQFRRERSQAGQILETPTIPGGCESACPFPRRANEPNLVAGPRPGVGRTVFPDGMILRRTNPIPWCGLRGGGRGGAVGIQRERTQSRPERTRSELLTEAVLWMSPVRATAAYRLIEGRRSLLRRPLPTREVRGAGQNARLLAHPRERDHDAFESP